jgi:hypothetical protein
MIEKDTTPDALNNPPSQAYELGKHLFGKHCSGQDNLSTDRKAILRRKLASAGGIYYLKMRAARADLANVGEILAKVPDVTQKKPLPTSPYQGRSQEFVPVA